MSKVEAVAKTIGYAYNLMVDEGISEEDQGIHTYLTLMAAVAVVASTLDLPIEYQVESLTSVQPTAKGMADMLHSAGLLAMEIEKGGKL